MGRITSLNIGISSVVTISALGVIVFLQGFPIWAYGLWALALLWVVTILFYRRQSVTIDVEECTLSKSPKDFFIFIMKGFIRSRHPEGLRKLELMMQPEFPLPAQSFCLPDSINSVPQRFEVTYSLSSNILDEAMKRQNIEWDIVLWIQAVTSRNRWLTDGFLHPVKMVRDGHAPSVGKSNVQGSLNKKTQRKKGKELGINQKQFDRILAKASQPIEKSEKGKSPKQKL